MALLTAALFTGAFFTAVAVLVDTFFVTGALFAAAGFVAVFASARSRWYAAHRFFVAALMRALPSALILRRRRLRAGLEAGVGKSPPSLDNTDIEDGPAPLSSF